MNYRFYLLNASGLIDSALTSRHADDSMALAYGQALAVETAVEVWQHDRRVGLVPPRRRGQVASATTAAA